MTDRHLLLQQAAAHSQRYLDEIGDRPVHATASINKLLDELAITLPVHGEDATSVIDALANVARTGTTASQGPRYFGFVTGSSLPVATAADWLVSAWDQNTAVHAMSPFVAVVEEVTGNWLCDLVGLPRTWSAGFVTGGTMANFTALAAARHHVLAAVGWDVEHQGLAGAPPVTVVVSDEAHYSVAIALRLLGLGDACTHPVPTDAEGRIRPEALAAALDGHAGPCIVCAQAGNVNTGAFDPLDAIATVCARHGAWLHVDGAVGLWAVANPAHRHLFGAIARADSIAADAHKWLNVPYDCGIALCAHPQAQRSAMRLQAPYITREPGTRDGHAYVPEESRRARAVPVYAALRTLGRDGLGQLVARCCRHARRFADGLREAGCVILNDVVLNQVLVSFGDDVATQRTIAAIQAEGTCWCGGTQWKGRAAMRISVASWATTDADVEKSLAAMIRVARGVAGR